MASAVGAPQVASAGGVVAAVVGAVVARPSTADAGPPKKVDIGRTSEQTMRMVLLGLVMMVMVRRLTMGGKTRERERRR